MYGRILVVALFVPLAELLPLIREGPASSGGRDSSGDHKGRPYKRQLFIFFSGDGFPLFINIDPFAVNHYVTSSELVKISDFVISERDD